MEKLDLIKEMDDALDLYRKAKTTADKTMYRKKRMYLKHKLKLLEI